MTLLFLGPLDSLLLKWLVEQGEIVIQTTGPITPIFIDQNSIDFLISCGYRHILKKSVLDRLPGRAVNLHIAYLPWGGGVDPNLWSFIEGTPSGVTIHYLDEGIDTGDIIAQRRVAFESAGETLATTYQKLQSEIQRLFKEYWPQIRAETCPRIKQSGHGSFHWIKDKEAVAHLLADDGWDTPIEKLRGTM